MTSTKAALLGINVAGGFAVLGSYALGLMRHPGRVNDLWGGAPETIRGLYGISMLLAAAGYLLFLFYILVRMEPGRVKLPWDLPFASFHVLFLAILVPSALWMSLTFAWVDAHSAALWASIRAVLLLVGLASVALFLLLARLRGSAPDQFSWTATIGAGWFAFHTFVLDGILWPVLFRG